VLRVRVAVRVDEQAAAALLDAELRRQALGL